MTAIITHKTMKSNHGKDLILFYEAVPPGIQNWQVIASSAMPHI
jgi:hypothetical protein